MCELPYQPRGRLEVTSRSPRGRVCSLYMFVCIYTYTYIHIYVTPLTDLEVASMPPRGCLEATSRWPRGGLEVASRWPRGGLEVASRWPRGRVCSLYIFIRLYMYIYIHICVISITVLEANSRPPRGGPFSELEVTSKSPRGDFEATSRMFLVYIYMYVFVHIYTYMCDPPYRISFISCCSLRTASEALRARAADGDTTTSEKPLPEIAADARTSATPGTSSSVWM